MHARVAVTFTWIALVVGASSGTVWAQGREAAGR